MRRVELIDLHAGRIRERSVLLDPLSDRVMSMSISFFFLLMRVFISYKSGRRRVGSWLILILLLACSENPPPLLVSVLQLPIYYYNWNINNSTTFATHTFYKIWSSTSTYYWIWFSILLIRQVVRMEVQLSIFFPFWNKRFLYKILLNESPLY